MGAAIGPNGRRKRFNELPMGFNYTWSIPGTSNTDAIVAIVMPSDGWVGHSVVHCSNSGTGTSTDVALTWRSAATGGGSAMTGPLVDSAGALITIASAGGKDYAAEGTGLPANGVAEGNRLFLNTVFTGTVTAGGTWEFALSLIL